MTLFCTVTLPSIVNSGEMVTTSWLGPRGQFGNSSSVALTNTYSTVNGVFQSSLAIASFSPTVDNGNYVCNATIVSSSANIIGNSATAQEMLAISGKYIQEVKEC